jgi:peroxiredoxin
VLQVGDRVPQVRVQRAPGDEIGLDELPNEGPVLFLFYLFDWSST